MVYPKGVSDMVYDQIKHMMVPKPKTNTLRSAYILGEAQSSASFRRNDQRARVRVTLEKEVEGVVKFVVDLGQLNGAESSEVFVSFKDPSIFNNDTFFTDSNGLDMVKRRAIRTDAYPPFYQG